MYTIRSTNNKKSFIHKVNPEFMQSYTYRRKITNNYLVYWKKEKLDKYFIPITREIEYEPFFNITKQQSIPFPPEIRDLVNLHKLIRKRKVFTVMEFGVGYSSIIIADALLKNKHDFEKLKIKPKIRKENTFELHSIDPNKFWLQRFKKQIPSKLKRIIHLHYSEVQISEFNGRMCNLFKKIPNIIPDFIYVDGPAAYDVKGMIRGISFNKKERTIMNADLLTLEPFFVPGTFILIDGRTNSARFLKNNFQRTYKYKHDVIGDRHQFELNELPLGVYNKRLLEYCGLI